MYVRRPAASIAQRKTFASRVGRADLHGGEETRVGALQAEEARVLRVVLEGVAELLDEALVGEERAGALERHLREVPLVAGLVLLLEPVEREDVVHAGLGLQAHEDLEAEEHVPGDAHEIARDAVVLGANALVGDERELGAAEDLLAPRVERLGLGRELGGLLEEPLANDVVAAHPPCVAAAVPVAVAVLGRRRRSARRQIRQAAPWASRSAASSALGERVATRRRRWVRAERRPGAPARPGRSRGASRPGRGRPRRRGASRTAPGSSRCRSSPRRRRSTDRR